jgi:hypothetical protein
MSEDLTWKWHTLRVEVRLGIVRLVVGGSVDFDVFLGLASKGRELGIMLDSLGLSRVAGGCEQRYAD